MNRKNIITIIETLLTYLAIKFYNNFSFFGLFPLILFVFIYCFYNKSVKYTEKDKKLYIILSLIFSIFLSLGSIVSKNLKIWNIGFLTLKSIVKIVIIFIGLYPFIFRCTYYLINYCKKINITSKEESLTKKNLIIIFFIIFISWFPFFLRYFPAAMTPDSYYVVHNVLEKILSDHHTFGFTWFFAAFFSVGRIFFKNINLCIAVYTIFQMLIMDLIFVYGINYLSKLKVNKKVLYVLTVFIAINPLFSHYSVTLWRDILFGMQFVIITLQLHKYINSNYKYSIVDVIIFTLSIISILFFRNNGIFVFMFLSPFLIFIGNKDKIKKAIYCIIIVALYFTIKGPVFNYFNVSKGISSEAYSIPIQQISRVLASDKKVDKETKRFLDKLYDTSIVKTDYIPTISDNMKRTIDTDFLNKHKSKFYETYLNLFIKYPGLYFEAYFTQTLGYWYPDINQWSTAGCGSSFLEEEVKSTPLLSKSMQTNLDRTLTRKLPFTILFWSIGLNFYILIYLTSYTIYKKGFNNILYFIPIYSVWITLMLASPVYCELRYIFALFATIPYLLVITLMNNSTKSKSK